LDPTLIAVANRAVANLVGIVNGLESIGAQRVLVPGMPDLGLTPFYLAQGPAIAAQATGLTNYFDTLLMAELPAGATYFDTAGLLRNIVASPGAYGLTNVTNQCFNSSIPSLCANPDQYLFWDDFHPTARGHVILADALAAAIPEPATWILMASSLCLFAWREKGRRNRPPY
jgi:phospholipase/lecithinase/hemolysin